MKYIPILYNTEMVQALQRKENPKTQTRRLNGLKKINEAPDKWTFKCFLTNPYNLNDKSTLYACFQQGDRLEYIRSPYGNVGDVLWVRETWSFEGFIDNHVYKADGLCLLDDNDRWYPNIHMPKSAARIFLELKGLKIERLQNLSNQDALAEGIEQLRNGVFNLPVYKDYAGGEIGFMSELHSFESLWGTINGRASWDKSPWVWVYTFKNVSDDERHWHNLLEQ